METINRLQFRHHNEIFDTREDAIEYIYDKIKNNGEGLASEDNSPYSYSLFAEPTILRYKNNNEDDSNECGFKKGNHIMLVIGSETNDTIYHDQNRFCIIDIDKTEEEIENLQEELEAAIKSLTIVALSSDTINLFANKTDDGTIMSGDVKVADTHVFDNIVYNNNLMVTPQGLFIYVDLTYDEATETFTFVVSTADGKLKKQDVKLPNNYLVSGIYKWQDESLHFRMKDGEEIVVSCKELIYEWDVDDNPTTPIVLTRERVEYDPDGHHEHEDILSADIRVASDRPANILDRTADGRYLYVDGVASNIVYYWNGDKSNVEEQLNKLNKIKVSPDNDNIIWDRADGFFASVKLDYITSENKLVFTTSTVNAEPFVKEIPLNTFEIIESITYDPTTETLIIKYKNDKGETKTVRVPISGLIDEWEVLNNAHSVKLVKQRKTSGKDILTADVNISTLSDNILVERGEQDVHALYVKGTAGNIKYGEITVEDALNNLSDEDINLNDKIDAETLRATEAEGVLQGEIDAISADSASSLKDIINNDKSIDVDKTNPVAPVIKVNLSESEPYNTLRLERDGLYNFIDLRYDADTNKLTLIRSDRASTENVEKEIQLSSVSFIDSVEYDPTTETLIIKYHSGAEQKELRIPLGEIFHEWEVYNNPDSAVKLNRERVIDGKDKLSGEVVITTAHTDNILSNEHGALYVPANTEVTEALSNAIDAVDGKVDAEVIRAISAETALSGAISTVQTNLQSEIRRSTEKDAELESGLATEQAARIAEDQRLYTLIVDEAIRATNADEVLDGKINDEAIARTNGDAELKILVSGETAAREAKDTILETKIDTEITRSTAEDQRLTNALDAEKTAREQGDAELANSIREATLTFEDTNSIDFTKTTGNVVTADVKLQGGDNIIKLGSGLYATATLEYEPTGNKIRLVTSNGAQEYIQLVGATLLDSIEYDPINKILIIRYTDGSGSQRETSVGVTDLWNEWVVDNPSERSAVQMVKTIGDPGNADTISARVLITDEGIDPDGIPSGKPREGSDNIIEIRNNGLYVCGSAMTEALETALCAKNELKAVEKAVIGHIVGEECGSGYTYEANNQATYINSATSFNNADFILDQTIKNVDMKVEEVSAKTDCVDGKATKLYKLLYGADKIMSECGESEEYIPYPNSCVISSARSFMEADMMLNDQICEILEMWVSGMTCTSESDWKDEGANKKMLVNVRLSHGNNGEMTDDDLTTINLDGAYIDPTNTEFTDTNALRVVCLQEGPGGVKPDISTLQNGIYLSNVWDCGLYYSPSDTAEKAAAEAAGYNTNYSTDESPDASNFNYMNNVRQEDI